MIEQIDRNDTRELKETQKNWLNSLIIRTPGLWSSRLGLFMARLRSMTRIQRRRLGRAAATVGASAAGLALLALMAGPLAPPVHAATINVNNTTCTLADAIKAANTDSAVPGSSCTAGSAGADTIVLAGNVNLAAKYGTEAAFDSMIGLPVVSSTITIQSSGSNEFTIARTADDTDKFRIFTVDADGDLTLRNLTVSNGYAYEKRTNVYGSTYSGRGGAIYSKDGNVQLDNVTLSANKARDHGGAIYIAQNSLLPSLDITSSVITGSNASRGGAIGFVNGTMSIESTDFINNTSLKGAIYADNGTVTISDTNFTDNTTNSTAGGAIYNDGTQMTIINSTFSGNSSTGRGGAIYGDDGSLTIVNTTFSGNHTLNKGGAIYLESSALLLSDSTFSGNYTANMGGALYFKRNTAIITNTIFTGNSAIAPSGPHGDGGAIYLSSSATLMQITNSTISDNEANGRGGGIYNDGSPLTIISSTISNNSVISSEWGSHGGGLYLRESTTTLINTTLSGNTAAANGGGVAIRKAFQFDDVELNLVNVTVTGNSAGGVGGGLYGKGHHNADESIDTPFSVNITRTIISGNTAAGGADEIDVITTTVTTTLNVLGHSGITYDAAFSGFTLGPTDFDATTSESCRAGVAADCRSAAASTPTALTDILDTTLADNGGTEELPGGENTLTHDLPEGSPAIDLVPTAECELDADQRGISRPQIDGCDAGAVEYTPPPPTACFDEGSFEKTLILGSGMGSHTGAKPQVAVRVANPTNVITNYGQIVGKETAAYNGIARFTPAAGSKSHIWVYTPTAEAELQGAEWWYGTPLTPPTSRLWKASMFRGNNYPHQPRAFVMYPTYGQKELHWDYVDLLTEDNTVYYAPGWTPVQSRTIELPGALPYSRDISVRVAAVDNDADRRPIKVTVRTVGEGPSRGPAPTPAIELTQMPVKPTHGKLLNIMHFFLNDVPAGTTEIVVEWSAEAPNGDSFTVTGITANYECGEAPVQ